MKTFIVFMAAIFIFALVMVVVGDDDEIVSADSHEQTQTPIPTLPSESSTPTPLRQLLGHPDCVRACWRGIEPGLMSLSMLKVIWRWDNIEPETVADLSGDENNALYLWPIEEQPPLLIHNSSTNLVMVTVDKGIVTQLVIPLQVCISDIVSEYGIPEAVNINNPHIHLLYTGHGLSFEINKDISIGHTMGVILLSEPNMGFFLNPPGEITTWEIVPAQLSSECE